jgi:hypothetical protein
MRSSPYRHTSKGQTEARSTLHRNLNFFSLNSPWNYIKTRIQLYICIYTHTYIHYSYPATLRYDTVWLHGWEISVFPKNLVSTLLSMIIFTGRAFPHPSFTSARDGHKRQHGYNYSYSWVQNSYQLFRKQWFDTNVGLILFLCQPFQPSPVSLLRVVLFWSVLLSMLLNYKKLSWCLIDWQLSIPNVNGHAYSYPLPTLWRWGLNLDLNDIERVVIHLSVPENYGFNTIISEYFYRSLFLYGC